MKIQSIFLLSTFLLSCAGVQAQQKYNLNGNITGVTVPTYAFLAYTDGEKSVRDSSLLSHGKFSFHGQVSRAVRANLWLLGADKAKIKLKVGDVMPTIDGTDMMLEPTDITVEGTTIASAKITAGQVQADYNVFNESINAAAKSGDEMGRVIKTFILSHPNSQVSHDYMTDNSVAIQDAQDYEEMYKALSSSYRSSNAGQMVAQRIAIAKKFAIGQPAINFTQMNDKGEMVSLADVNKGKYVLIDFWASWCGPCRTEYPYLKKAYAQYKDKNFEIIGVSLDDNKASWLGAIKSNGFQWIELCDLKGRLNEVAKAYGIAAIPQSFLIDPQGRIIAKNLRGNDLLDKLHMVIKLK